MKVGDVDARGRTFLGWRVFYTQVGRCPTNQKSVIFTRRDQRSDLGFSLDDLAEKFKGEIKRVYRPLSKLARAEADIDRLLVEAKGASNYLHHPEFADDPEIQSGMKLCGGRLYYVIVDIENRRRAERG